MRRILIGTAICLLAVLLTAVGARADNCATTTLNNILGTTCMIGDKTFQFFTNGGITGIASSAIVFTPVTTNALSPGFTLSSASGGPISVTAGPNGAQSMINANINYTVSLTNGSASLLGSTFTLSNAAVTLTGTTNDNGISDITNFLGALSGASVEAFIQCAIPAGPTGCNTSTGPTSVSGTGTFATPVASASGQAGFEVLASGGGTTSASFTNATYLFNEAPVTAPEPSALFLLGTGLCSLGFLRRKTPQATEK